ncbi:MAG: monovalent cation/H(+) antiporter subunit G [Clostridia bacterium]|nr:monovalent cation/H(+) antiporter subunit G [Clostridia bacterium]
MICKAFYLLFMCGGLFFFGVGTLGILRMPSTFARAHSAAKCDTLGAALCMLALVFVDGFKMSDWKLLLIVAFIWLTNPTATHLIGRTIFRNDQRKGRE